MPSHLDFIPPYGVRNAVKTGLRWYEQGHGGDGLVDKTIREARSIARGDSQSVSKVRRMRAWFARHEVDRSSQRWKDATSQNPSPSMVAWALWGGDAGRRWAEKLMRQIEREEL